MCVCAYTHRVIEHPHEGLEFRAADAPALLQLLGQLGVLGDAARLRYRRFARRLVDRFARLVRHEGEIVETIHQARGQYDAIIINPAAFTHTSVAIRDALAGVAIPFVEVHLSNVHQREAFRHHSYFSDLAVGVICGLGAYGYEAALRFWLQSLK